MYKWKGITFSKEFKSSLAEFKKSFASNENFKAIPHDKRDAELEKVWKAVMKYNGFDTTSAGKGEKDKPTKNKE